MIFNKRPHLLRFLSSGGVSQLQMQITAVRCCVPVLHAAFMARLPALSDLLSSAWAGYPKRSLFTLMRSSGVLKFRRPTSRPDTRPTLTLIV